MTSFQRMIAIPQEEYLALSSLQNAREPLAQHFYSLERRYADEEKVQDPYRRMLMQGNTLDQMKQVKDQMRNSLIIATPKPYQNRAKALFQSLENVIKFNDKGEIYADDGNLVVGSRLEDLIQHAVRDRRRNVTLSGWRDFLTLLRTHNIPKSMLNRNTLDELEGMVTPIPVIKREVSPSPPRPSKQIRESRKREVAPVRRFPPARVHKPDLTSFVKREVEKKDVKFLKTFKK